MTFGIEKGYVEMSRTVPAEFSPSGAVGIAIGNGELRLFPPFSPVSGCVTSGSETPEVPGRPRFLTLLPPARRYGGAPDRAGREPGLAAWA